MNTTHDLGSADILDRIRAIVEERDALKTRVETLTTLWERQGHIIAKMLDLLRELDEFAATPPPNVATIAGEVARHDFGEDIVAKWVVHTDVHYRTAEQIADQYDTTAGTVRNLVRQWREEHPDILLDEDDLVA